MTPVSLNPPYFETGEVYQINPGWVLEYVDPGDITLPHGHVIRRHPVFILAPQTEWHESNLRNGLEGFAECLREGETVFVVGHIEHGRTMYPVCLSRLTTKPVMLALPSALVESALSKLDGEE